LIIPRDTINLIRERAQIEEIIKRYIPSLKKRGNNYVGLCPFHKDNNPSFTVSPEKRIFHCFGCQEGGNIFTFISKIEGLNFPESVRFVGKIVGIEIPEEGSEQKSDIDKLYELNRFANSVFTSTLHTHEGKGALQYLAERGVHKESIQEFKIGYAPESWNYLTDRMKSQNISLPAAAKIGLLGMSEKERGKHYYDKFRKRIIFPILAPGDNIAGFGGRILGDGEPKYLNSPESEIFQKRSILYGFPVAKRYIIDLKRAIIVEGYLDVIGCHQADIKNVVAPLGTALTGEQVALLSRYVNEIILLFDADSAGVQASLRSLDVLKERNLDVRVAMLPEDDPFEYIKKRGIREFMSIVDSAVNPVDFKIRQIVLKHSSEDRFRVLVDLFSVIKELEFETERSVYLKKISSLLEIDENAIRADFIKFLKKREISDNYTNTNNREEDFLTRGYRDLVILLCYYPELFKKAALDFSADDIDDLVSRNIFLKLNELYTAGEEINIDKMFDFFAQGEEQKILEKSLLHDHTIENPDAAYTEIYINLRVYRIDKRIEKFVELVKTAQKDNTDVKEYLSEIEVLRREKEKLSTFMYSKRWVPSEHH
jgi:DNA primase